MQTLIASNESVLFIIIPRNYLLCLIKLFPSLVSRWKQLLRKTILSLTPLEGNFYKLFSRKILPFSISLWCKGLYSIFVSGVTIPNELFSFQTILRSQNWPQVSSIYHGCWQQWRWMGHYCKTYSCCIIWVIQQKWCFWFSQSYRQEVS